MTKIKLIPARVKEDIPDTEASGDALGYILQKSFEFSEQKDHERMNIILTKLEQLIALHEQTAKTRSQNTQLQHAILLKLATELEIRD